MQSYCMLRYTCLDQAAPRQIVRAFESCRVRLPARTAVPSSWLLKKCETVNRPFWIGVGATLGVLVALVRCLIMIEINDMSACDSIDGELWQARLSRSLYDCFLISMFSITCNWTLLVVSGRIWQLVGRWTVLQMLRAEYWIILFFFTFRQLY